MSFHVSLHTSGKDTASLYSQRQMSTILSWFPSGRTTGIAMDSGVNVTHIVPIDNQLEHLRGSGVAQVLFQPSFIGREVREKHDIISGGTRTDLHADDVLSGATIVQPGSLHIPTSNGEHGTGVASEMGDFFSVSYSVLHRQLVACGDPWHSCVAYFPWSEDSLSVETRPTLSGCIREVPECCSSMKRESSVVVSYDSVDIQVVAIDGVVFEIDTNASSHG